MAEISPINLRTKLINEGGAWWPDVVLNAELQHPSVPLELAVIAETDPAVLNLGMDDVMHVGYTTDHHPFSRIMPSSEIAMRTRVQPKGYSASHGGSFEQSYNQLFENIHDRRVKLTKAPRLFAALLATAAIGFGSDRLVYTASSQTFTKNQAKMAKTENFNEVVGGIGGGVIGMSAGFEVNLMGYGILGSIVAQQRAKRKVKKIETDS
jgi:hypothetical protein